MKITLFIGWVPLVTGIVLFCLLAFSCAKEGPGGNVEVSVSVKHHHLPIPSALVYIKYGAKEFPGNDRTVYDYSVQTGSSGHSAGHAHVKELRHGQYYFYAEGFDSSIMEQVSGGTGLSIPRKDRKRQLELEIPVSE